MEVDRRLGSKRPLSLRDSILRGLSKFGVPKENLDKLQPGLVAFVKKNKFLLPQLIDEILPANEDISEVLQAAKEEASGNSRSSTIKNQFHETLLWLQWLMFEDEPEASLFNLSKMGVGQRGVCGVVWEEGDIAYHCRTCEHDLTCAICVPCFQNGDHRGHDYSLTYSGGGCCDCGDVTAWKLEGFCSEHRGAEQIEPLPEAISNSVRPVLDALYLYWKEKLLAAAVAVNDVEHCDDFAVKVANELSLAVVDMLLNFCTQSESLLAFVSKRMLMSSGLLDTLVRAERFLQKTVVKKLHELLLKLLGEPTFKYEFAKVFLDYYPIIFDEAIRKCDDSLHDTYPLLSVFSVQIFTVPTLTPCLVREMNLLGILLRCLADLFVSCTGEKGYLEVNKWINLYKKTIHLLVDIRYVMSHAEVMKYAVHEVPDLSRSWIRILTLVQGMDPQKRVTGHYVEEENENVRMSILLGDSIGNINSLLVGGAFSINEAEEPKCTESFHAGIQYLDDSEGLRHPKVGRFSEETSVCSMMGRSSLPHCYSQTNNVEADDGSCFPIPSSVLWLTYECLNAIDSWLEPSFKAKSTSTKSLFKISKSRNINMPYVAPSFSATDVTEGWSWRFDAIFDPASPVGASKMGEGSLEAGQIMNKMDLPDTALKLARKSVYLGGRGMEAHCAIDFDKLFLLGSEVWPEIVHDVSSQDISFNIPLHRLLSLLLQKALRKHYDESGGLANDFPIILSSGSWSVFFQNVLRGCHPQGFAGFIMEHPLQLRVFCAQVRAGMWKKNGEAAILSFECYRSVQWCEQSLEFDLFLLQCCAALAPPELFVERVLERFGLSNYSSLSLKPSNEYEPVLVQEMLSLIIQIIKERRFCGLSTSENLRRELVCKLAVGDATHSELVRALPHDLSNNDHLQQTLDALAIYSNPSGMKQGKYSLRESHWKELDLYHPRWNPRVLQIAEERYLEFCKVSALTIQLPHWTQIFYPLSAISAIAISKAVQKLICSVLFYAVFTDKSSISRAPDAVLVTALHLLSLALEICCAQKQASVHKCSGSVELSHSCDQSSMSNPSNIDGSIPLLVYACEEINMGSSSEPVSRKCESMITLLVSLMRKYRKENEHGLLDASQCNFSALVEDILKKFAELNAECMNKLIRLAPDVVNYLSKDASKGIQTSAMSSDVEERKVRVREHQAAILEKMRAEQAKFIESLNSTANSEVDFSNTRQEESIFDGTCVREETAAITCSLCRDPDSKNPLSYLIFLQKSRLTSFVEGCPPSWEEVCLSDKEDLSVNKNEATDLCGNDIISGSLATTSASPLIQLHHNRLHDFACEGQLKEDASCDVGRDMGSSPEMTEDDIYRSIQREIYDTILHPNEKRSPISDGQRLAINRNSESVMVQEYIAIVGSKESKVIPSDSGSSSKENVPQKPAVPMGAFDGFGPIDCDGIHVSSCGHAMHQECRGRYLSSLRESFARGIDFEGGSVVDPDQGEFRCPVCRRLANSVLPAFPSDSNEAGKQTLFLNDTLESVTFSGPSSASYFHEQALCLPLSLTILRSADDTVGKNRFSNAFSSISKESMRPDIEPVYHLLCKMYFPDRYETLFASQRISHSMIMWDTLRYSLVATEIAARGKKPLNSKGDSNSCMEDLCEEVQSSNGFILHLLLQVAHATRGQNRLQVLLRLRGIQLLAGSICSGVSRHGFCTDPGNISHALQDDKKGLNFPDIEFWKRVADSILAHDPFSSLMWVLFCLPRAFLSSTSTFLSFVHLFYAVCVIQALVASLLSCKFDFSELRFGRSLINDIWKIMGESACARQYFVSRHIDASLSPEAMIRRFTIPYLRRCALLWKLLKSSMPIPFSDGSRGLDRLSSHLNRLDRLSTYVNNDAWGNPGCHSIELKEIAELEHLFQISSLEKVLEDETFKDLAIKWCEHFCEEYQDCHYVRILPSTPAVPFKLMSLPHLYQDLLQRYIKQKCPECNSIPDEPALCLLCGRLCSFRWNSCCRENECQSHAMACGAGIGIFLLIKKTIILLQRSARQVFWHSVYLDAYGEEDIDLLRGKPLYLNEERYATLTHLVASHSIDQMSEVLRQTTIDMIFPI